jgi:hypothetical protein
MAPELKSHGSQNSFLETLHSEIVAGSENLTDWIKQIQAQGAVEVLFNLETRLKGIRAFFNVEHLPLSEGEKSELIARNFSPEISIIRQAIQGCETLACLLMSAETGEKFVFEDFIETQMRRDRILDFSISRMLEQRTPRDSVAQLLESLNDLRITIDAFKAQSELNYQLFIALGRSFGREIKNCRYIDMLMSQRFRLQYDLIDNKSLTLALRGISDDTVRRNMALALLYLFRFLKYLKFVSVDLDGDLPLKQNLVIFALLHEEMGNLSDFLRSRFLKNQEAGDPLRNAAELISYSLKMESQRIMSRELIFISHETDPIPVYARIENSHGLLRNCCQSAILTLVQSIDTNFDATTLFPSRAENLLAAEKLRRDLWALRQWLTEVLGNKEELDSSRIIERIASFREDSLRSLMYRDWAEFEAFSDALAISGSFIEARTHTRKFVSFLETLVQEVSKRSVFQDKQPKP